MNSFPIDPAQLAPFLVAVSLIELTPGPNMGYLAALSASEGRRAGFRAVLGITTALAIYMVLAAVGVAELIAAAPLVLATLRWAGVAFLVYLGWQAWNGARELSPGHGDGFDHAPFWRGFIANILNPKALIFYVALLPGFIAPDRAPFWAQAMMLGLAHVLVSVLVHAGIVVAFSRAGQLLAKTSYIVVLRRVLAIGIVLVAAWLAWDTRSV